MHIAYRQTALAACNLFVWFRAISFMRLFEATRVFIFMLTAVLEDLYIFFGILVLFLLAFGTTKSIMDDNQEVF